jgi:hypothetical protein
MADDSLKAGAMGPPGDEGAMPAEFADSMAARIESELRTILIGEGRDPFDLDDNSSDARDRRMLFVAIARGVVNYMVDHHDAFRPVLSKDGNFVTGVDIVIDKE